MSRQRVTFAHPDSTGSADAPSLVVPSLYGEARYFHNVPDTMRFPEMHIPFGRSYSVVTDHTTPGLLRILGVNGMGGAGPSARYTSPESFRLPWSQIVREDINAASTDAQLLECKYVIANSRLVQGVIFWYGKVPAAAERERLAARMQAHPLLRVGAPQTHCPRTLEEAREIVPFWTDRELLDVYGDMLRRPGDRGR